MSSNLEINLYSLTMSSEETYTLIDDSAVKITGKQIACEKKVEYPSAYFASISDKPFVHIYYRDTTLDVLRASIMEHMSPGSIEITQAIAYLYKLYSARKEKNVEEWNSYNIKIADANTDIDPFVMLKVNLHPEKPVDPSTGSTARDSKIDLWLPYVLTSVFRTSRVVHETYRTLLIENITKQAVGLSEEIGVSLESMATSYASWTNNPDYCKLMAALDMFYYRFPKSIYSNIRVGTITARYRECAALTNYQHLTKVVGSPTMGGLFEWVFNVAIKNDILRIFHGDEELDKEFSYFPYQVDFNLVQKSAYSASVNSALYVWGSIVCVLNKDLQSLNSRLLRFDSITDVVWNAKLLGYVKSNRVNTKVFFKKENTANPQIVSAPILTTTGDMPTGSNPIAWFNYMKGRNYVFPQECLDFFQSVKESIIEPREGTIGHYIKNTF
uniref:Nucleoprotein n=1 Tax=Bactrocera tryoni rhabdovirus 1 TaxID=2795014 RepID=A0A8A6RNG0_9RHAB|nr:nucleocapsid [Bactrocera tryoni rhabdovirus 1]